MEGTNPSPLLGLAGLSTVVFLAFALIALIFIRGNARGRASADEPGPGDVRTAGLTRRRHVCPEVSGIYTEGAAMAVTPDVSEVDLEGSAAGIRRGDTIGG